MSKTKIEGCAWDKSFRACYEKAIAQYQAGNRNAKTFFTKREAALLHSIGSKASELYDLAEDAQALSWETALLITAVRRDYFLTVQHGQSSTEVIVAQELPPKDAELDGIPWLPRLIAKASARLRGELPDALMYCCGGDRKFFKQHNVHPADFLRLAWVAAADERKILAYLAARSGKRPLQQPTR